MLDDTPHICTQTGKYKPKWGICEDYKVMDCYIKSNVIKRCENCANWIVPECYRNFG